MAFYFHRPKVSNSNTPTLGSASNYNSRNRYDSSNRSAHTYIDGNNKAFTREKDGSITVSRNGVSNTYKVGDKNHNIARRVLAESGGNWNALKTSYDPDGAIVPNYSEGQRHYDKNTVKPPAGSVPSGNFINGSYSSGGRTFERDRYGNMIIKDSNGTKTYAPDTTEHNLARKELMKQGGNWDSMKAYQPIITESPGVYRDPTVDMLTKVAEQYEDGQTQSLGMGVRPAPLIKSAEHFGQWMGNMGEYYAGKQFDRENMGSANDLALQANSLGKQNAIHNLEGGRARINQYHDEQDQQAYVQQMQGMRNLEESLAVQGLGGGATESAKLAMGNEFQEGMNRSGLSRANALADLDRQIQSEAFRWDQQAAEIEAQTARDRAAAMERGRTQAMEWGWRAMQAAQEEKWRQQQFEADREDKLWDRNFRDRAYGDSRSDYADDQAWKQRIYDDDFYGRGFKNDLAREDMALKKGYFGLEKDKFAWQKASLAAKNRGAGSFSDVSVLPEDKGEGKAKKPLGFKDRLIQSAQQLAKAKTQMKNMSYVDNLIAVKQRADEDLRSGRIGVNEYNVIAQNIEYALSGR